jgi:hypothetical protein
LQLVTALIVVVVLERRFAIAQADNVVSLAKPENQAAAAIVQPQWSPSEATLGPGGSW